MSCAAIPCANDCIAAGTYNVCIDGYDLGSTTGGLSVKRDAEYVDVRNDQSCTRQARYLKQQDWMFSTTLQCVTLDKMKLIYGLPDSYTNPETGLQEHTLNPEQNRLVFTDPTCVFQGNEFSVMICGPGPGCGCRYMSYPNVVATPESLDYTITKDNPVQLEVEFTILADCMTGIIGTWTDDMLCSTAIECSSNPIPVGPIANGFNAGLLERGTDFSSILANDFAGENENLTFEIDNSDPNCQITLNPDGTFSIPTT